MHHLFVGSVTGDSHARGNKGNEDSYFVGHGPEGWSCCVVADGCGSSRYAAVGARSTAELVGEALLRVCRKLVNEGEGDWIIDEVAAELAGCRMTLRERFGPNLLDYSATVVAALHSPRGGFFLHIGDGLGLGLKLKPQPDLVFNLSVSALSLPENGEYANQTFYLSEPNWIRHFRLSPLPETDIVLLMSDGAQDAICSSATPDWEKLCPLLEQVVRSGSDPGELIRAFLSSDTARALSGDDKTLAMMIPEHLLGRPNKVFSGYHSQPHTTSAPPPATTGTKPPLTTPIASPTLPRSHTSSTKPVERLAYGHKKILNAKIPVLPVTTGVAGLAAGLVLGIAVSSLVLSDSASPAHTPATSDATDPDGTAAPSTTTAPAITTATTDKTTPAATAEPTAATAPAATAEPTAATAPSATIEPSAESAPAATIEPSAESAPAATTEPGLDPNTDPATSEIKAAKDPKTSKQQ